ncbi:MAG: hypothetical protein ACKERG_03980 [Candidatus Hodgkinia cicadicola]
MKHKLLVCWTFHSSIQLSLLCYSDVLKAFESGVWLLDSVFRHD